MRVRLTSALVLATLSACEALAGIRDLPGPPPGQDGTSADDFPGARVGGADASTAADPATVAPSCAALPKTCGSGASDCCEAPLVPGGSFVRDYDGRDATDPRYRATVSAFRLDRFEVTVGRFRVFMGAYAAGWRPSAGAGKNPSTKGDTGWLAEWTALLPAKATDLVDVPQRNGGGGGGGGGGRNGSGDASSKTSGRDFATFTDAPEDRELRPINYVTWLASFAFCIWDGGRLPTDTEWSFAAAGGDEQRYYPWLGEIDDARASYYVDATKECFGDKVAGCSRADVSVGGAHPLGAGKWGHVDLAGNLAEWVRDGDAPKTADCVDCIDATNADGLRRQRGGAFETVAPGALRVAVHEVADPSDADARVGFRCARNP